MAVNGYKIASMTFSGMAKKDKILSGLMRNSAFGKNSPRNKTINVVKKQTNKGAKI